MKFSKYLLRIIQVITGLALCAAVIFGLILADVIPVKRLNLKKAAEQKLENLITKVKRQKTSTNLDEVLSYEKKGDAYLLQKNYQSALQNFEFVDSLAPANSLIKIKIVRSLLGLRKILDAKIKLETIQPETQTSLYYLGFIAAFLNDQKTAKDNLSKSMTIGTDETLKNNAQKILTVYKNFELARDGKIEFLQTLLAEAFDQAGEYGLAIELAFDALKTQHDYRDAWIVLGHAFLNEQKFFDAEDAFIKAVQLDAGHPTSFFFRGIAKKNLGKINEAISDFEQALKLGWQPKILAKEKLADSYFELKDFEKAFLLYKEIVTTDPSDIKRFVRPMALAINHLGKPQEATELAKKAYETHPNSAMGHNLLGWAFMANNDLLSAHKHLKEAIERDPELDAAYLNFGQLAEREGDSSQAMKYYKTAVELAQKAGNKSIEETARIKLEQNTPAVEKIIPSLSLE